MLDPPTIPAVSILGVRLHALTRAGALEQIRAWLRSAEPGRIVATVNAEFIMNAQTKEDFRQRLNRADLALADGIGPVWAASFLARPLARPFAGLKALAQYVERGASIVLRPRSVLDALPEKIPGSDFTIDLSRLAAEENASVFLLGGGPGIADKAAERLRADVPGLRIAGAQGGAADGSDDEAQRAAIQAAAPAMLFVAFDAWNQLAWMERNLPLLPSVRVGMGVGGTFDFLAGARDPRYKFGLAAKQPPSILRTLGLDWLWRLITQPYRWRRVWTAFPVFSTRVLREKIRAAM